MESILYRRVSLPSHESQQEIGTIGSKPTNVNLALQKLYPSKSLIEKDVLPRGKNGTYDRSILCVSPMENIWSL